MVVRQQLGQHKVMGLQQALEFWLELGSYRKHQRMDVRKEQNYIHIHRILHMEQQILQLMGQLVQLLILNVTL